MSQKSRTCISRTSQQPLTEYASRDEAQEAASYLQAAKGLCMAPYQCKRCGLWHLCPMERQTPSKACPYCCDGHSVPKQTYRTEADALRRAEIIGRERGISLRAYECPHFEGWHLTKSGAW